MNRKDVQVICCGHAAYDLNFMMDKFPVEDRKYKIDSLIQTGGGPAANAATLLSRWGIRTAYAGLVGDDIYGRLIISELEEDGVDTSLVRIDASKSTPLSAVIVNTDTGSRTLLNRRDEKDQPAADDNMMRLTEGMDPAILHFDGHALELSLMMIKKFPAAKVVIDAGSFRPATDRLCTEADYAICSKRYAEVCTSVDNICSEEERQRSIRLLADRYPGKLVITLGADGLLFVRRTGDTKNVSVVGMDAFEVPAVDSTGAGDIFHAAFSYAMLQNLSFETGLRLASAAAALSVGKPGGRTSIPDLKESMDLAGIFFR